MGSVERCVICHSTRCQFATATILGRHDITYYRCEGCGLVQTEEPYWLAEAYSDAIGASDIGLVGRNLRFADTTRAMINLLFDPAGRFVDYGGGYGLLVRLMRDRGFDFYRDDPMCENIFARGFDRADGGPYELVTAYEVLEHMSEPLTDVGHMLQLSDNVLFSTLLIPQPPPRPEEWWYYALDGGQHVSLYTRRALAALADRLGVYVSSSHANDIHLLTKSRRAARWFGPFSRLKSVRLLNAIRPQHRPSLLADDYERITGSPLR
jgi:Methyltransferase domain